MTQEILTSKKYWRSVLFIGVVFIIIYSCFEYLMQHSSGSWQDFVNTRIANGHWVRYLISRLVGGLLYGMIMAYYFERRKRKTKE